MEVFWRTFTLPGHIPNTVVQPISKISTISAKADREVGGGGVPLLKGSLELTSTHSELIKTYKHSMRAN